MRTGKIYGTRQFSMAVSVLDRGKVTKERKDSKEDGKVLVNVRSGGPSTATCEEVKEQLHYRIRDNRRINTDETTFEMRMCHGKKRYKNDLKRDRKYFILMELGYLGSLGKNALKSRMIT